MVSVVKKLTHLAANSAAFARLVEALDRRDRHRTNVLRVLTYHRVDWPDARPHLYPSLISATPEAFSRQMEFVAAQYQVVSLAQVLDARRGGAPLPPRSVLVTFDDAYRDFAEHAWPVLERLRLPAVLFVPTAFPDQPQRAFWWDRLYAALDRTTFRGPLTSPLGPLSLADPRARQAAFERLKLVVKQLPHDDALALVDRLCEQLAVPATTGDVLSWEELKQLARRGLDLGAHTRTHPLMHRVSALRARAEALGSLDDLRHHLGAAAAVFAYPSGGFDAQVVQLLRDAGFELAFTTGRGVNDLATADPLRLRRVNVGRRTTLPLLQAQLLSLSTRLNRWRAGG
jgi:peptidoglycan/xylan/chitin deacetylase (PgdA/CDA1 family)